MSETEAEMISYSDIEECVLNNGRLTNINAYLSRFNPGGNIAKQSPELDPRNYGYAKLGELVAATKLFEIKARQIGDTKSTVLYVRDLRKK